MIRSNLFKYLVLPILWSLLPLSVKGAVLFGDNFDAGMAQWAVVNETKTNAPSKWYVTPGGNLRQISKIGGITSDPNARPGTYVVAGDNTWKDYAFSVWMKTPALAADSGSMGLMFGYQNPRNYYRFTMDRTRSTRQLVKVVNGMVTVLGEDRQTYDPNKWHRVEARLSQGEIEIQVNYESVFLVRDTSHVAGKIGLHAWKNPSAMFEGAWVNTLDDQEPCKYSITPGQASVSSLATPGNIAVTTDAGCSWTASANVPWVTLTSGKSGSGEGTVEYAVAANGAGTARQATLTIAGLSFAISQAASAGSGVIYVPAGGDLQRAIDQASPGSTITLQPGAEYVGNFVLRVKPGAAFITITSSDPTKLPPPGKRMSPTYANSLPKIVAPNDQPAISTDAGAHHYRLVGLEVHARNVYNWELIRLGTNEATQVSQQPRDIELDRMYVHGHAQTGSKRGVALNSASTVIRNSYFSNFMGEGQDTQAIAGWNGPGPFEITNNYLEGAGENVMFGGALPRIRDLVPSDIKITKNHFYKPLKWCRFRKEYDGSRWYVKNLLELKMGRRVTIEGNVFENSWQAAQAGFAIVFTVRANNSATWAVVEDITFVRNIVRHASAAVNVLGKDYNSNDRGIARRILIKDNLFEDIDYRRWGGEGRLFMILHAAEKVTIDHNTVVTNNARSMIIFDGDPVVNFVYRNNIAWHGDTGVLGSGSGMGNSTLNRYAPGAIFTKNVMVAGKGAYPAGNYIAANYNAVGFTNYAGGKYDLSSRSPYKGAGTDKKDLGADMAAVTSATAGVVQP